MQTQLVRDKRVRVETRPDNLLQINAPGISGQVTPEVGMALIGELAAELLDYHLDQDRPEPPICDVLDVVCRAVNARTGRRHVR